MRISIALRLAVSTLILASPLSAATIVVSPNGAFTTLQAGIDAAAAGDTVLIKAGTYSGVATIPAAKSGLTLKGSGKVVLDARGPAGAKLGAGIVVDAVNVTIRGLTIVNAGNVSNNVGNGIRLNGIGGRVEKCVIRTCQADGLGVFAADCEVRKCAFSALDDGVFADDADRLRISSCSFRAVDISVNVANSDDVVVENVRAIDTGANDVIRANACPRFTLRNLKAQTSGVVADLEGPDITIDGVDARRCGGGIFVGGTAATIRNVVLRDCLDSEAGIRLEAPNSTVTKARFTNTTTSAIVIDVGSTGCIVRDCRANRCGSLLEAAFDVQAGDARLEDCRVDVAAADGFSIAAINATLLRCRATGCAVDGIDLDTAATDSTLEDCVAQECLAEGFDISATNVVLTNCKAKKNRIDFANDGTLTIADVEFVTGGANVAPEIE